MIGRLDGSITKDWTTISRDELCIAGARRTYPQTRDEDSDGGRRGPMVYDDIPDALALTDEGDGLVTACSPPLHFHGAGGGISDEWRRARGSPTS